MTLLVVVLVGVAVGLLSGLVGIGGGVLMVPFLYFFYDRPDLFGIVVAADARVVLAHGTSLLVIMPTSLRGALAYHRARLVEWRAVWPIGIAAAIAALVGSRLAVILPPEFLKTGFGTLLIASGVRMLFPDRKAGTGEPGEPRLGLPSTIFTGSVVGLLSALLGVGGGTVAIPLLIYFHRLEVRKVAATSIAIIGLTAAAGSVGYMISGIGAPGLPSWTIGYVHLSAGIALLVGALASVRWGAALNQRMKPRTLTVIFGALFVILGLRLAGANLLALLRDAGEATGFGLLG